MRALHRFLTDEQGQDLTEYTLLVAAISLAAAAIFMGQGSGIQSIWNTSSRQLSTAVVTVDGAPAPPSRHPDSD